VGEFPFFSEYAIDLLRFFAEISFQLARRRAVEGLLFCARFPLVTATQDSGHHPEMRQRNLPDGKGSLGAAVNSTEPSTAV